jgi:DNA-3-methyladenine glycosylase
MPPDFYAQPVIDLAQALIGCTLLHDGVGGVIVETEAYHAGDPASHSFAGETARNRAMWGPPGRAYVYHIYGIHWCLNVVGGAEPGAAVLLRALEPTHGFDRMYVRRGTADPRRLCSGPGKLCQALGVTGAENGLPLDGHAHRDHQGRGRALALRSGRLALPQPPLPGPVKGDGALLRVC